MTMSQAGAGNRAKRIAVTGGVLLVLLVVLGFAARGSSWTAVDLGIDRAARGLRTGLATSVSLSLTAAASEMLGIAALLVGVVVLVLRRMRVEALRLLVMAGASWVLAIAVKDLVDRPRPPASLWLLKPDPTGSFPSGHDTTASVMVLVVAAILVGTGAVRVCLTAVAVAFALAVGVSRVYLGDHYPTDVLGSYLAVAAAAMLVWAVFELVPVRRLATRLVRGPAGAPRPVLAAPQPAPESRRHPLS